MTLMDRDKAVEEALKTTALEAGHSCPENAVQWEHCDFNAPYWRRFWSRAQEAEREENCKAMCGNCRMFGQAKDRNGGAFNDRGWWHRIGESRSGGPLDERCDASPIRARAPESVKP